MSRPSKDYRPTLDGWRAIAILLVMLAHGGSELFYPAGRYASSTWYSISQHGVFGVDLFFGISGLLICGRLLDEHEKTGGFSLGSFYIRRVFRILPPAFTYLAIVGLLALSGFIVVSPREWFSSVFFSRNYIVVPPDTGWYTGHFWSLAVEEHFYLIWPAALLTLGSARARRYLPGIAIAVAIWRIADFHWFHGQIWPGVLSDNIYERTDTRFDGLLWGCWIALVVSVPAYRETLTRRLSATVITVPVLVLVACIALNPPLQMAWESFLVPVILLGTVLNPTLLFGRILETSPMRWVGRISYSLYLWQQLFLVGSKIPRPLPFGRVQEWPLNIVAVFVCASASYYLLERPLVAVGHSLSARFQMGRNPIVAAATTEPLAHTSRPQA
ncbi:acyltransferase family protein [Candidatus Binatus sp.]|uniref:acyltransferase family protein n=1 Tax=Candidatus Binatus sp. TaxID=2811406 RepID=UPI003CB67AC1